MDFEELKTKVGSVSISIPRQERVFIETEEATRIHDQLVKADRQRIQVLKNILS